MDTSNSTGQSYLSDLPTELLFKIFQQCPDVSALWSLLTTSSRMLAIFNARASEIVDDVLNLTVPVQTRLYMRQVLVLRIGIYSYSSFEEAQTDISLLSEKVIATPEQLRSFVALSHRIHVLAHLCIERCLRRCMDSPLGERKFPVGFCFPTWTEEQRSILSFWRVLFYNELKVEGLKGHLEWSTLDLSELLRHGPYQHFTTDIAKFQAMTALRFISELPEGKEFGWTCQPPPSLWAVTQGWNPDDPRLLEPRAFIRSKTSLRILASYSESDDEELLLTPLESEESESEESEIYEFESDEDDSDDGWGVGRGGCLLRIPSSSSEESVTLEENPSRDPEITSPVPLIQDFGQFSTGEECQKLHGQTIGVQFWNRMRGRSNAGPGQYIRSGAYLKYGFAIWEEQRMIDMGLWSTQASADASECLRRWYSFLSEEDLNYHDSRRRRIEYTS
ncbi:hypothetical protein CA14_003210 [Aspergillus flavus]|uniref:F-box domain-containing protein n=1 Tax=Aspergillus flavus TaxID=5059 RepID=A0AB74BYC9_ASPFL|nr:hypothetical protein CA14_003210 [Aspergillus flavus]